jgi:hypothetical protein
MPTSENGLGMEDYLQQFHNYEHHYQDEEHTKPEWYELPKKQAAPKDDQQQTSQQAPQQMPTGNSLANIAGMS